MPTTYWLKFGNTPLGYNGKALKTEYTPLQPGSARAYCFYNCGSGTITGAAELAQIPSDRK